MKITIYSPDSDASKIDGFTVVVDVLRAFSVSYFIHENMPLKYIALDSIENAFELKEKIPNAVLIGERQGIKVPGFDYGNSPTEIIGKDFSKSTLIHTTTAGTKGLIAQKKTNEVFVGSFVNANALIKHIQDHHIPVVNIYCTAPKGEVSGEEDYYFAEYLKRSLLGRETDFDEIFMKLKNGTGKRFSEDGFAPYSDFEHCMDLNKYDVILRRKDETEFEGTVELEEVW